MNIDVTGLAVLLDGCGPATAAQIGTLLSEGASVTLAATDYPTSVRDLAERGLITIIDAPTGRFDVVLRATTDRPAAAVPATEGPATSPDASRPDPSRPDPIRPDPIRPGPVTLVGGGPGDPGLLTVAGLAALRAADVVVHDRLAPLASLAEARGAQLIDVGKIPRGEFTPQERINAVLIEHALAGRNVVRFKGGDNFVFGRGGEEAIACTREGIEVRVIPGVTSSVAGPALAGIPVTHRDLTQGFTVVSGHAGPDDPRSMLDWAALARTNTTLVVLMGVATLPAIARALIGHGLPGDTPAASIADAGLPSMLTVRGTLATIGEDARNAGIRAPAVTVIGQVAALDLV